MQSASGATQSAQSAERNSVRLPIWPSGGGFFLPFADGISMWQCVFLAVFLMKNNLSWKPELLIYFSRCFYGQHCSASQQSSRTPPSPKRRCLGKTRQHLSTKRPVIGKTKHQKAPMAAIDWQHVSPWTLTGAWLWAPPGLLKLLLGEFFVSKISWTMWDWGVKCHANTMYIAWPIYYTHIYTYELGLQKYMILGEEHRNCFSWADTCDSMAPFISHVRSKNHRL